MGYEQIGKDMLASFIGGGYDVNDSSVQKLIPVKDINLGMIVTEDYRYIKIIEVEPSNFPLKDVREQDSIIATFAAWLKLAPVKLQIKVSVAISYTNSFLERLIRERAESKNPVLKDLYDSNIEFIEMVTNRAAVVRRHYVIFEYEPTKRDAEKDVSIEYIAQQMTNTVLQAKKYLAAMGNTVVDHQDESRWLGNFLYKQCNMYSSGRISYEERGNRVYRDTEELNAQRKSKGKDPVKLEYANIISPMGISRKTTPDSIIYDNMYHAYYYITGDGYPMEVNSGWLTSDFSSIPGVDIDIFIRKENKGDFIRKLSQQIKFTKLKASSRTDENKDINDIIDAAQSQRYMMDALSDRMNFQDPYYVVTLFSVHAPNYEMLEDRCEALEELAQTRSIKVAAMTNFEELGFVSTLPLNNVSSKIYYKARRNLTTDGVAGFYPFTEFELNDPEGLFLGINLINRTICTLDLYNRDKYSNANMVIFGGSGAGKTYTLSLLASRRVLEDKQVFVITSEKGHEFRRLNKALGGTFVKYASSDRPNLNVFEIRPESDMIDALTDSDGSISWLAKKMASIDGWLQLLFKDLSEEEKMILDRAVKDMYEKRGITDDNNSIFIDNDPSKGIKEMPIISDLLNSLFKLNENENTPVPRRLISMLSNFVSGSYSAFNSQTNVDLSEDRKIIVFDLEDISSTIEAATIHMTLDFIWGRIKEDPTKQKTIIIEEGWKYLSRGASEASAKQIQEIYKLIRGYGGNAILATQEIGDILASEYGRSLIECSSLKILMGVEDGSEKLLQSHFNLLPGEADALTTYRRGACLLLAGKDHIPLQVQASPLEHKIISTDIRDYAKEAEEKRQKANASVAQG